jgi:hypothetical protein
MLVYRAGDGPAITPVACWSDGAALWLTVPRQGAEIAALRGDPSCALWIAPRRHRPGDAQSRDDTGGDADAAGVAVDGTARIFDVSDPVRLALHAPVITAALAALALTHRSELAGYMRDLPRASGAWMAQRRALVRVRIDRARSRMVPGRITGVGPVLPTELPAAVRRALTGIRQVTLATQRGDALMVQPAVWGAGFQLEVGTTVRPGADTPACIAIDHEPDDRQTEGAGLMLRGTVDGGLRFHPDRATWWQGLTSDSTTLRAPATTSGIVLPD